MVAAPSGPTCPACPSISCTLHVKEGDIHQSSFGLHQLRSDRFSAGTDVTQGILPFSRRSITLRNLHQAITTLLRA